MDMTQTTILEIVLRARNETTAAMRRASADADTYNSRLGAAGATAIRTGLALSGVGAAMLAGVGAVSRMGADFEASTQALANNTTMSTAALDAMRSSALALQAQTGQSAESIAQGFMFISNHAYSGAAAMNILTAATKNAAATMGDASDDANLLAGILREYNVSARALANDTGLATRYLDTLHNAVAKSNYTMRDFVDGTKGAIATAATYGVTINDISAALATLSEHGYPSAQQASENMLGVLQRIAQPTAAAEKALRSLSAASGINLVADFTEAGLRAKGLSGIIADLAKATGGDMNAISRVMPEQAYARELIALIRNQEQYTDALKVTTAALAGQHLEGMVSTNEAFARQQATLKGQVDDLNGSLNTLGTTMGLAVVPQEQRLLNQVAPLVTQFGHWATANKTVIAQYAPMVAGIVAVGGALTAAMGGALLFTTVLGAAAVPVLALAALAAVLGVAYVHNIGNAREAMNGFMADARKAHGLLLDVGKLADALQTGKNIGPALGTVGHDIAPVDQGGPFTPTRPIGLTQFPLPWEPGGVFNKSGLGAVPYGSRAILPGAADAWNKWALPAQGVLPGATGAAGATTVGTRPTLPSGGPDGGAVPYGARAILPGAMDTWTSTMARTTGSLEALTTAAHAAQAALHITPTAPSGASTVAVEMAGGLATVLNRETTRALQDAIAVVAKAGNLLTADFQRQQVIQHITNVTTQAGRGTDTQTRPSSLLGVGGGGPTINITVQVNGGAVQVTQAGGGNANTRELGLLVGEKVADALARFTRAEQMVGDPPHPHVAGAR